MGNRATPSRSFNTVKHSNREERRKRHQKERMTLLSIFVVVIAILLSLLILSVGSIVDIIRASIPSLPDDTETNDPPPVSSEDIQYMQITKAKNDIHVGDLILVNADHAYIFPTANTHLVNVYENRTKIDGSNIYQVSFPTYQLERSTFEAFETMMKKFYTVSDGDSSVLISSAYRTLQDQEDLGSSVQAGYSDHHTGYCVALKKYGTSSTQALETDHWIYAHCYEYGFIVRYPESKSEQTGVSDYEHCFRYVGVAHATYISQNNLCLEKYVDLLKKNYTSTHLAIQGADGNGYEVYYVPADEGITQFSVPQNYKYTISGDNMGGFIVTVHLSEPVNA